MLESLCKLDLEAATDSSDATTRLMLPYLLSSRAALSPQACKYVPGSELLQMDPSDAVEKLRTALKVLGGFKLHYFNYKSASVAECPAHPWRFQNSIVFGRLDTFMQRCADMLELQSTCLQVGVGLCRVKSSLTQSAAAPCKLPCTFAQLPQPAHAPPQDACSLNCMQHTVLCGLWPVQSVTVAATNHKAQCAACRLYCL